MKKAMVERMKQHYPIDYFPETGSDYPVRVFIYKDEVTAALDTTGDSLHKRGYRRMKVKAPIAENLAAGLIMLTPWQPGRVLVDPFCGSGTFLIEAALMSANIAPGLFRHFIAEDWTEIIPSTYWAEAREEARDMIDLSVETDLQGYDIDPAAIAAARENARLAGVEKLIHFQTRPISALSHPKKYGFIITNPPYGERLSPGSEALSEVELTDAARARVNTGALAEPGPCMSSPPLTDVNPLSAKRPSGTGRSTTECSRPTSTSSPARVLPDAAPQPNSSLLFSIS